MIEDQSKDSFAVKALAVVRAVLGEPGVDASGVLAMLVDGAKVDAIDRKKDQVIHTRSPAVSARRSKSDFHCASNAAIYAYASYIVTYTNAYAGVAARLNARAALDDAIASGAASDVLIELTSTYDDSLASTGVLFAEFTTAANSLSSAISRRTDVAQIVAYAFVDSYVAVSESSADQNLITDAYDDAVKAVRVISANMAKDSSDIFAQQAVDEATTKVAFAAGRAAQATEVALTATANVTLAAQDHVLEGTTETESRYVDAKIHASNAAAALAGAVKEVTAAAFVVMRTEQDFFTAVMW